MQVFRVHTAWFGVKCLEKSVFFVCVDDLLLILPNSLV